MKNALRARLENLAERFARDAETELDWAYGLEHEDAKPYLRVAAGLGVAAAQIATVLEWAQKCQVVQPAGELVEQIESNDARSWLAEELAQ